MSLLFLLTAFVVVVAPGTGGIHTLAVGLGQGRRAAIAAAFGCTVGIVRHLLAAILGLAAILHTSAVLFQVVKAAGARRWLAGDARVLKWLNRGFAAILPARAARLALDRA